MHVSNLSTRNAIYQVLVVFYPTFVEQSLELALANRFHVDGLTLSVTGIVDAEADRLSCFAVEHPEVVGTCFDFMTIDALDDASCLYFRTMKC